MCLLDEEKGSHISWILDERRKPSWSLGQAGALGKRLHLFSTVRLIRAVLPVMKQQYWGRIITITSEAGTQPDSFLPHYSAAKTTLTNLTKSLSRTYIENGILVNTVSPDWTWTPLVERAFTAQPHMWGITFEEFKEAFLHESRPSPPTYKENM